MLQFGTQFKRKTISKTINFLLVTQSYLNFNNIADILCIQPWLYKNNLITT